MSIADQIRRIKNAKAAIKEAIQNKGVSVSDTAKLDEYPALIDEISVGGSCDSAWPNFFEWRTQNYTSFKYLFTYAIVNDEFMNLIDGIDTTNVKDISYAFNYFNYSSNKQSDELDLTHWDVSKVAYTNRAFYYCGRINNLNISGWDFQKSDDLDYFIASSDFNTINMANCNTSTITSFDHFLYYSSKLISIDMTGCDTSMATDMNHMFSNCSKLTTITGELDASRLSNGFYNSSSNHPFNKCASLETVYIKNIYKYVGITNVAKFSINLGDTKVKDECLVYIINELPDLINDKGLTATDKIVLTLPTTNTLTAEQVQVAISKGWQVANTTY